MGLAAYGTYRLFALFAGVLFPAVLAVLVGAVVYVALLVKMRGITERELRGMPKGNYLVYILQRLRIL